MTGGRSAILTYHSLDDSSSVISIAPSLFQQQMEFLAASGIPVVPLDQASQHPGCVAITFDDGYRNLLDCAIPVLELHRLPATIFVVSEYCGRRNNWPGQPRGRVPDLPLLSWDELSALPPLIALGAHTMTHPNLIRQSPEECKRELRECQDKIQQRTGKPVRWLAYPYGASSSSSAFLGRPALRPRRGHVPPVSLTAFGPPESAADRCLLPSGLVSLGATLHWIG